MTIRVVAAGFRAKSAGTLETDTVFPGALGVNDFAVSGLLLVDLFFRVCWLRNTEFLLLLRQAARFVRFLQRTGRAEPEEHYQKHKIQKVWQGVLHGFHPIQAISLFVP